MTRSIAARARAAGLIAATAAAAVVGGLVPATGASAAAAPACVAPSSLAPDDGPAGIAPERKDLAVTWAGVSGAPSYDLQFSPNQDYTSNLTLAASTVGTRFVPPLLALPHGAYFWRVRVSGATCWSDEKGTSAEFTRGWRTAPELTSPVGTTVTSSDVRFSWKPVDEASSYLLQVDGNACVTQATTFTPYDVPVALAGKVDAERLTANPACTIGPLGAGAHSWRVFPLDDTGVKTDGAAYVEALLGPAGRPDTPGAQDTAFGPSIVRAEFGAASPLASFTVVAAPAATASTIQVSSGTVADDGSLTGDCSTPATPCASTPTLSWNPVARAAAYRVSVATDASFTHTVRAYDTAYTSLTPREQLLDSQSGGAYWVQVCTDTGVCSPTTPSSVFRKRAVPANPLTPAAGATVTTPSVTLAWADQRHATSATHEAAQYEVQIATNCSYTAVADDEVTDATEVTPGRLLLANGSYYWRVRELDASGSPGPWSEGNRDTPVCGPAPRTFTVAVPAATAPPGSPAGTTQPGSGTASAGKPVTVDTTSRSVGKRGSWRSRRAVGSLGGSVLVANGTAGERLSYAFFGRAVAVGYCTGPMDGSFALVVDGRVRTAISARARFTRCGKNAYTVNLPSGQHTVEVRALGRPRTTRNQLAIDYIRYV